MRPFIILLLALVVATPALAAPKLVQTYRDWNVFTIVQSGQKICYISTEKKKESGTFKRRGKPYLLVTYRGNGVFEVSASSGYPYKANSNVELRVDGNKFSANLFTSNDTPKVAWAKTTQDDKNIVNAMKKGSGVTIKATSRLNTHSTDSYSLMGFTKAHKRMLKLCK